jgi:hypothetical protein
MNNSEPRWTTVTLVGGTTGVALAALYAQAFAIYATLRASMTIVIEMPPDSFMFGTLIANAASILLAAIAATLIVSLITAILGAFTALAVFGVNSWFNRPRAARRATFIGFGVALAVVLTFQLVVQRMMGQPLTALGIQTYLFWLGLPAILHLGAGTVGARYLNHISGRSPTTHNEVRYEKQEPFFRPS